MPLKIINADITTMKCDAIVNPTNRHMQPGGGADEAIHRAAGPRLLEYCRELGSLSVGEARITPAFKIPCKYIIHTAGPLWDGGLSGEKILLRSCYESALRLAEEHGCQSVAFPLIASGAYGYPKERVLREAVDVISRFLEKNEMEIFLLVYDKSEFSIDRELMRDVRRFLSDNLASEAILRTRLDGVKCSALPERRRNRTESLSEARYFEEERLCAESSMLDGKSLEEMLSSMDMGFAEALFHYIDEKGLTDVECYKRSNVDKKTFSKVKCNKNYRPGKITAVSFAVGLRLNYEETSHLLSTAGMCLSRSSKFDVIIEYFIRSGRYESIFDINEVLYQFDQPLLGV